MLEKEYLICYVVRCEGQNFPDDFVYETGEKMNKKHLEKIRSELQKGLGGRVVFTNIICLGEIEDE